MQTQSSACGAWGGRGRGTGHVEQRRVSDSQNVVLVHLRRAAEKDGEEGEGRVVVDERLAFSPGAELELVGAVYSVGGGDGGAHGGGRCVALSRGPDGMYWVFDRDHCRRLRMALSEVLPRSVTLLVYARAHGWASGENAAARWRCFGRGDVLSVEGAARAPKVRSDRSGLDVGAGTEEVAGDVDCSGVRALTRTLSQLRAQVKTSCPGNL